MVVGIDIAGIRAPLDLADCRNDLVKCMGCGGCANFCHIPRPAVFSGNLTEREATYRFSPGLVTVVDLLATMAGC